MWGARPWNPAVQRTGVTPTNPTPTATSSFEWERREYASSGEIARAFPTPAPYPARRPGRFPRQGISDLFPSGGSSGDGGGGSSVAPGGSNPNPDPGQSSGGSSGQSSGGTSQPSSPSSQGEPTSAPPSSQPPTSPTTPPVSPTEPSSQSSDPPSSEPPSSTSQPPSSSSSSESSASVSSSQPVSSPGSSLSPTDSASVTAAVPSNTDTSSGIHTTIYSTIVTDVNGQLTTITSAIPTTLPYPSNQPSSTDKHSIIIGCAVGGTALAVIVAVLIIFLRRSNKVSLNYKKLRVFGRRRKMLEDEDEDDWLGGGEVGMTTRYRDYPASVASSSHPLGAHSRDISASGISLRTVPHGASPAPSPLTGRMGAPLDSPFQPPHPTSPYLMGPRASSSGSIFHEGVWPPPGESSRFVDPLVSERSLAELVDLAGIAPPSGSNAPSPGGAPGPSRSGASTPAQYPPTEAMSPLVGPSSLAAFDPGHSRLPSYGTAVAQGAGGGLVNEQGRQQGANLSPASTYTSHRTEKSRGKTRPPPALQQSWERAQTEAANPALYDDPYAESSTAAGQSTLRVRNASPTSPGSPASTVEQPGGFAALQANDSGASLASPKNWFNRPVRKDV